MKTHSELVADLEALDLASEINNLDLVLEVLVGAGLLFLVPEAPADHYQLIHDYLVSFIRQKQAPALLAELAAAKEQQKQTDEQLRDTLKQLEKALLKEHEERKRAEITEIETLISLSQALFLSHDQLGALLAAVKALRQLQETELALPIKQKAVDRIRQVVCEVQDGKTIASVSGDKTIKLWRRQGIKLQTLELNELLVLFCDWLRDYLKTNPNVARSDRHLCNDVI